MVAKKAVFLDRDGVINEDSGYVHKIKDFKFLPGVFESLRGLQSAGYLLIVITNQSGISRGFYTENDFKILNNYMLDYLDKQGIKISKVYCCQHHPNDNCECRKPKTKSIEDAVKEFDLDITRCWMIGDKLSDTEMGRRAGCKTILIGPDSIKNLYEASRYILEIS